MDQETVRPSIAQQKLDVLRKLVGVMTDIDVASAERQAAKRSLQRVGNHTIVEDLGQAIEQNQDDGILNDIVDVLSSLPINSSVRGSLVTLLWDDSPTVRHSVIETISRRGDRTSAPVLSVVMADSLQSDTIFDEIDGQLAQQALDVIMESNC